MNYYPGQLRRIAEICEGLNPIDGEDVRETEAVTLGLQQRIKVVDEHGDVWGTLSDEIGGSWSFTPVDASS